MKKYLSLFAAFASINSFVAAADDDKQSALRDPRIKEHHRELFDFCKNIKPAGDAVNCTCKLQVDPVITITAECNQINDFCAVPDVCGNPGLKAAYNITELLTGGRTPLNSTICFNDLTVLTLSVEKFVGPLCVDVGAGLTSIGEGGLQLGKLFPFLTGIQDLIANVRDAGIQNVISIITGLIAAGTLKQEEAMSGIEKLCSGARIGGDSCNSCTGCLSADGEFGVNFDCTNIDSAIISTSCGAVSNVPMKIEDVTNFENPWVPQLDGI